MCLIPGAPLRLTSYISVRALTALSVVLSGSEGCSDSASAEDSEAKESSTDDSEMTRRPRKRASAAKKEGQQAFTGEAKDGPRGLLQAVMLSPLMRSLRH